MPNEVWDKATYPFPNFNGYITELSLGMDKYFRHTHVYVTKMDHRSQEHILLIMMRFLPMKTEKAGFLETSRNICGSLDQIYSYWGIDNLLCQGLFSVSSSKKVQAVLGQSQDRILQ